MKTEIEKSQEKQKRNRQVTQKSSTKPLNPQTHPVPEVQTSPDSKVPKMTPAVNTDSKDKYSTIPAEIPKAKPELKVETDNKHENKEQSRLEESKKSEGIVEFKVDTEEKEIDLYKNPESPRPAPPVFDENYEVEAVYNKEERKAKEREALELAQKLAHEQKLKVEQELGQKKNELNQLEGKYENIAAKYMNK